MKRFLSAAVVFALLLSLMPFGAFAVETGETGGTCGDNLTWTLDADGTLTISGTGAMDDYWVVYGEEGDSDVHNQAPWQQSVASIQSVVIEAGVTKIGTYAFAGCPALANVDIPDSLTTIGSGAFYSCTSLTGIELPNALTSIEAYTFAFCTSLTEIDIPDGVTSIGGGMGSGAFYGCSALERVNIPNTVTLIDSWAFCSCASLTSINIPNSVTKIGSYAFNGCTSLKNVTISDGVTIIGWGVFGGCTSLTDIEIPNGVTTISESAFAGCIALKNIELPQSLTYIGVGAFGGCRSLISIDIPDNVTEIYNWAFSGCTSLTSIELPNSLTGMMYDAFSGCTALTSIVIPASVTSVEEYSFNGCAKLSEIIFEGDAPAFAENCFGSYASEDFTPEGPVTAIAYYPANNATWTDEVKQQYGGNITWVEGAPKKIVESGTCGENLTWTIDDEGTLTISGMGKMDDYSEAVPAPWVAHRYSIGYIVIEDGVQYLGSNAFDGLYMNKITFAGDAPTFSDTCFTDVEENVYYPKDNATWTPDVMQDYGGTIAWCYYGSAEEGIGGTCGENVTWVLDKEGTLTISGTGAMTDYTDGRSAPWREMTYDITNIVIEDGVTRIGNLAFLWFLSPFTIELPDTLTEIGDDAFYYAKGLHSINIPDSVTSIEGGAFAYSGLDSIVIPDGVTTLEGTFCECMGLESVKLPASLTKIGLYTFFNCYPLTRIEIPAGVTEIGGFAFLACEALSEIIFTGDAPTMADSCFDDVTATVYYPANNATWTGDALFIGPWITCKPYSAEGIVDSGTCGENLTWKLDIDCILTISGTDTMDDYSEEMPAPWSGHMEDIHGVVIEEGVSSIGSYAFYDCYNPNQGIIFKGDAPKFVSDSFEGATATVYCPLGNPTWTSDVMQDYGGNITWIQVDGSTSAGKCGDNLTWLLDDTGTLTISGTGAMTDYTMETVAPWDAQRANVKNIVIEAGVTHIGKRSFMSCAAANLTIPNTVTEIGADAFWHCALTSIELPESLTVLDSYAFAGCASLTSINIPNGVTEIGFGTFFNCTSLASIEIPAAVTVIGRDAFAYCEKLTEIIFTGDAPSIGERSFNGVTTTAYYPANNATWTDAVKQNYGGNITWKPIYDILDGADTVWTPEEEKPVAVRADAAIEEFLHVMLNGELVDPQHYDVTEGSTIITFHEDFLATLEPGKYSVTMYFESGIANTSLTISTPAYKLGDVNGDGKLNAKDATAILKKIVGKLDNPIENFDLIADVNEDGKVNAKDATKILKTIVGKDTIEGWEK